MTVHDEFAEVFVAGKKIHRESRAGLLLFASVRALPCFTPAMYKQEIAAKRIWS